MAGKHPRSASRVTKIHFWAWQVPIRVPAAPPTGPSGRAATTFLPGGLGDDVRNIFKVEREKIYSIEFPKKIFSL